jgi:hypothetical protein
MDHPEGFGRSALSGCLLLVAGMSVFIVGFIFLLDSRCHYELTRMLPPYPEAELVYEDYNFFRPFGMGRTIIQMHSNDDFQTVGAFYGKIYGELVRTRRVSSGRYNAVRAEDGGTRITLSGACFQSETFSQ